MHFEGWDREEAKQFAARWLPAWTGNDPERLLSFYTEDTFYLDPAVPAGLRGRVALRDYFVRLLRRYPDWIWEQVDAVPMRGGFLNKWRATIPIHGEVLELVGVCTVELRDGLIARNEVYFDRTELLLRSPSAQRG
jgi:hypothetical protein